MNWYFYRLWIPLQLLTLAGVIGALLGLLTINWWLVAGVFFLMGPVGVGVGYHRLFSHRQFETYRPIEIALAVLGTLSAYAPVLFWASNHHYHHRHADYAEDPSSPVIHGFWESFFTYRMRNEVLKKIDLRNAPTRRILKDKTLMFLSKHFMKIIWSFAGLLLLIGGPSLLMSAFLIPSALEHLRTNVVSSLSHMPIPGSYRNHSTDDTSYNNVILGYLTFGFAWHNNHHNDEKAISGHEKWWEIDVEGLIAKAISK
jgi:stearoyl-CoA desaturase (delta-9 desaturase)